MIISTYVKFNNWFMIDYSCENQKMETLKLYGIQNKFTQIENNNEALMNKTIEYWWSNIYKILL